MIAIVIAAVCSTPINLQIVENGSPQSVSDTLDAGYSWYVPAEIDFVRPDTSVADRVLLYDDVVALQTGDWPLPAGFPPARLLSYPWGASYGLPYPLETSWDLMLWPDGSGDYPSLQFTNVGSPAVGQLRDSLTLAVAPEPSAFALALFACLFYLVVWFGSYKK